MRLPTLPTLPRLPLLAGTTAVLAACTAAQLTPAWESWFSANDQEDRFESVHSVLADPAGAVISVGVSSSLQMALDLPRGCAHRDDARAARDARPIRT